MNDDLIFEKLMTTLFNLELEHPLIMGAGVAKHIKGPEGLEGFLSKANASLLMGGTFTLDKREGNAGEVCWTDDSGQFYVNRMGLPNKGLTEIQDHLPDVVALANRKEKYIGISVSGISQPGSTQAPADLFDRLCTTAFEQGAHLVELNLSCPNTESGIIAFDPDTISAILSRLDNTLDTATHNLSVKVSPYTDTTQLTAVASLFNTHACVKGVTTINTVPNALIYQNGSPVITSGNGLAGLSGPAVFPIALGQVAQFRACLKPEKYIIGGGGVTTIQNVLDMRQAGADAVFLVSAILNQKPRVLDTLLTELVEAYAAETGA